MVDPGRFEVVSGLNAPLPLAEYKARLFAIVKNQQIARRRCDYCAVVALFDAVLALEPSHADEERLSTWEWAGLLSSFQVAGQMLDQDDYPQAAQLLALAAETIQAKEFRRARRGADYRHQTQERMYFYQSCADYLRKCPAALRDAVMPTAQLLAEFEAAVPGFKQRFQEKERSAEARSALLEMLGWTAIHVLGAVRRWEPLSLPAALDLTRECTGLSLPAEPSAEPPAHLRDSHWYWRWRSDWLAASGQYVGAAADEAFAELVRTSEIFWRGEDFDGRQYRASLEQERVRLEALSREAQLEQRDAV